MPDFSAYNWRELAPAAQPPVRNGHAMVWDDTRIVLFGGATGYGTGLLSDTWVYASDTWTQIATATTPSARWGHTLVFDGTDVIMHGGLTGAGTAQDTWKFNGTDWTDVTPGGTKPTVRQRHLAVWDGTRMIIYGGQTGTAVKKDTWKFQAGAWTQLTPVNYIVYVQHPGSPGTGEDGRAGMPAIWDGTRVLAFSGYSDAGGGGEFQTDAYQETGGGLWQYAAADWTQVGPVTNPDARWQQGFCVTDDDQKVLMYGGNISHVSGFGNSFANDTWQYNGSDWLELVRATNPGNRTAPMVWDTANARGLLFGGGTPGAVGAAILNDTWEFAADAAPVSGVYMPATSIPIE